MKLNTYLLQKKRSKQFDSIIKSPKLTSKFKDSIILERMLLDRKNEKIENYYPPTTLLAKLKYPEVYLSIKKWSLNNLTSNFYNDLLSFNDPETQLIYDKRVKDFVKSKGKSEEYTITKEIREIGTSCTYKKAIELLSVDKVMTLLDAHVFDNKGNIIGDDSYYAPFNAYLIKDLLLNSFRRYGIKLNENFEKQEVILKLSKDENKLFKFYQKNILEIKRATIELIKIKQKEEEYWMVNMPFYKKKK